MPSMWVSQKIDTSSNIVEVAYNEEQKLLDVKFHHGLTYRYFEVSKPVFENLLAAESKGKHFAEHIKHSYTYEIAKEYDA